MSPGEIRYRTRIFRNIPIVFAIKDPQEIDLIDLIALILASGLRDQVNAETRETWSVGSEPISTRKVDLRGAFVVAVFATGTR